MTEQNLASFANNKGQPTIPSFGDIFGKGALSDREYLLLELGAIIGIQSASNGPRSVTAETVAETFLVDEDERAIADRLARDEDASTRCLAVARDSSDESFN